MSAPDTVIVNTLEAILASDLNRIGGLAGKSVQDALAMLEAGIVVSGNTPRAAVRRGLDASPGTGMAVVVTAGELMRFDAGVSPIDASQYRLGRLATDTSVALSASDPVNPRVDVVHASVASSDEDSQVRNILTLPSRVVTPTAVFKSRRPSLTLGATAGVASANPVLPATPAGAVPLFYVYVPALATSVLATQLADARVRFHPAATSRAHGRVSGLFADLPQSGLSSLTIGSGRAVVNGATLEVLQDQTKTGTELSPDGATGLLVAAEYHLYAVARGSGPLYPVGAQVQDGFVPVLTNVAPSTDGRPSAAIQYRPLFGLGFDAWRASTTDALYLGTFHTDGGGTFQIGGDGVPFNRDGTARSVLLSLNVQGFPGGGSTWLRKPTLRWVSTNSVSIGVCMPVVGGVPGIFAGASCGIPADLFAGVAEAASTWYYVYLRPRISPGSVTRGTIRHYVLRATTSPPNEFGILSASPETGFQTFDYLYCGCFFNDAAQNISEFVVQGERWLLKDLVTAFSPVFSATPSITPARSVVQCIAPATAKLAVVHIFQRTEVTGAPFNTDNVSIVWAEEGRASPITNVTQTGTGETGIWHSEGYFSLDVPLSSLKRFEVSRFTPALGGTPSIIFQVFQKGIVEDVLGSLTP